MNLTIRQIINRETLIVKDIRRLLDNNLSQCRSCDEEAIRYHNQIIDYLCELEEIKHHGSK